MSRIGRTRLLPLLLAGLLSGCQTLQTAQVSDTAVEAERAKQLQLVKEIRAERTQRLGRIAARLRPEAVAVCNYVKGNYNTSCRYPVRLRDDQTVNASADGSTVYINSGIVNFAKTDDELALVVGHEIAHNMLSHVSKTMGSTILGALIDGVIAGVAGVDTGGLFTNAVGSAYSKEYESEADYLGLYLAARAGYDISGAPNLWRRMAIENPGSIAQKYGSSHPSTPERYVALETAVREIDAKLNDGVALIPNLLKDGAGDESEPGLLQQNEEYATGPATDRYGRQVAFDSPARKEVSAVGQWEYEVRRAALGSYCKDEPPAITLLSTAGATSAETYDVSCGNQRFTYQCNWGDCQPVEQ